MPFSVRALSMDSNPGKCKNTGVQLLKPQVRVGKDTTAPAEKQSSYESLPQSSHQARGASVLVLEAVAYGLTGPALLMQGYFCLLGTLGQVQRQ